MPTMTAAQKEREKELVTAVQRSRTVEKLRKDQRDKQCKECATAKKRVRNRVEITNQREKQLEDFRDRFRLSPREQAVKYARNYVGHTEKPGFPNSDNGGAIDRWNTAVGMPPREGVPGHLRNPHAYWCGSFVHACLKRAGVDLPDGVRYCPTILVWAKQGSYGLSLTTNPQPGDLALFDFNGDGVMDHVGLYIGNGQNIEGNTSPGSGGSQNNGGGVYVRSRRATYYVRVTYPQQ